MRSITEMGMLGESAAAFSQAVAHLATRSSAQGTSAGRAASMPTFTSELAAASQRRRLPMDRGMVDPRGIPDSGSEGGCGSIAEARTERRAGRPRVEPASPRARAGARAKETLAHDMAGIVRLAIRIRVARRRA